MTDQNELMGILSNLKSNRTPVTFYNTYRGLPFNCTVPILKVEQGSVATRVQKHQAVSMGMEGCTHLHSSSLPEVIRANVVEVDYRNRRATLSEFRAVGDSIGKRGNVRVQPGLPIDAQISDGRRYIRGRIADISADGICIFTYTTSTYTLPRALDREVFVDFMPPGFDTVVRVMGLITNIREQEGSYLHRLGLKIFPGPEIQPLLDNYIAWQKQAILREVELAYHSMCQDNITQGS